MTIQLLHLKLYFNPKANLPWPTNNMVTFVHLTEVAHMEVNRLRYISKFYVAQDLLHLYTCIYETMF